MYNLYLYYLQKKIMLSEIKKINASFDNSQIMASAFGLKICKIFQGKFNCMIFQLFLFYRGKK